MVFFGKDHLGNNTVDGIPVSDLDRPQLSQIDIEMHERGEHIAEFANSIDAVVADARTKGMSQNDIARTLEKLAAEQNETQDN